MRTYVIQQSIPHRNRISHSLCDRGPDIEFLRDGIKAVLVAIERVEGSEHSPPRVERFSGVSAKTTHVGADHGYLKEGGKFKDVVGYADAVVVPNGEVVA